MRRCRYAGRGQGERTWREASQAANGACGGVPWQSLQRCIRRRADAAGDRLDHHRVRRPIVAIIGRLEIASTTRCDSASITSPKMVAGAGSGAGLYRR